ncbi:MAG TPA: hypothetical protein VIG30_06695 [Ktedonobacterales bacterium]|jgi:predicted lipoprotein with Yx(FWY)xxD motif
MRALKPFSPQAWPIAAALLLAFLVAGCGATTSGGSAGASATATTPAAPAVQTTSVSVKGTATTVLTTGQGRTLYYFDPDSTSQATCTGGCAQTWPAFTTTSGAPADPTGVSGVFSTLNGGNGDQVTYNGHPLYMYSGDSAAGQANGDGILGKWHVATPTTPMNPNNSTGGGTSY